MGRSKKSRPAGRQPSATGKKAKPPATPQEAWEQAIAAYEGGKPRQAQNLLAPLLDMASIPGEVSLLAGLVEAQLGDSRRAEEHLRRAVQLVPQRTEGWLGLGNAQHMQGRFDAAVETYRRALKRSPDNPTALYNMAMTLMDQGRHRDALDALDRLLELQPEWPGAERNRAVILGRLRWPDEARAAYERLLDKNPDDARLRLEFAEFLEQNNQREDALAWLPEPEAFGDSPRGRAWVESLRAQFMARDGDTEGALERVRAAHRETGQDFLGFREGLLLDRLGRPDEAMRAFERGNRAGFDHSVFRRMRGRDYMGYLDNKITRGISVPDETASEGVAKYPTPVFIVGLPRSGTTLLDRMLGAHPDVQVLEEFDSVRVAEHVLAKGSTGEKAREAYWDYVERHIDIAEGALIVDKNPLHAAHLDNLPALFPKARVIFALRHPYDAALSCYMQDFDPNPASVYFLELESTAKLCAHLLEMMRLFEQACPERTIRLRYEDLIEDFPGEVTRVLRSIGLDWHEDVADYAEHASRTGMVPTPSYEQITRPLYRASIGRWQRYRDWLGPFREHIGPLLGAFGYDEGGE